MFSLIYEINELKEEASNHGDLFEYNTLPQKISQHKQEDRDSHEAESLIREVKSANSSHTLPSILFFRLIFLRNKFGSIQLFVQLVMQFYEASFSRNFVN